MKRILITLIIILSCPLPAFSAGTWLSWDTGNTVLQVPVTVLIAMDLGTTLDITRHPDRYEEVNPLLGKHPPQNRVWKHFIGSYLIETGIVYILPPKWSHAFQVGVVGIEFYWVNHNINMGLRVKF